MKRLLVFVFAVVLLWSCRKTRSVHFQAVMTSNTNILSMALVHQNVMSYNVTYMAPVDGNPIPVGEIYTSDRNIDGYSDAKKGDIISTTFEPYCDSLITTPDTIQCDFEILLGFFVDDVLTEERIISHSSSKILQPHVYSGVDILDNTIDFTVP